MLFGLPWYAIVAIVSIAGGLFYAFKEKEIEMESKRMTNVRELNELRKVVHNLKSRIETLESDLKTRSKNTSNHSSNPLGEIEIDDEVEGQNSDNSTNKSRNRS
ncbi:hypothetical protein [Gracilimonas amylolytica]|uniref:hypothetical protein n=1 Tax=Gracilimonas amylolytica TaxID=1749045 RepID=UPI000CD9CF93|nr:hypothetical protein [Gracilimonas amylolytica]